MTSMNVLSLLVRTVLLALTTLEVINVSVLDFTLDLIVKLLLPRAVIGESYVKMEVCAVTPQELLYVSALTCIPVKIAHSVGPR
jgi:hypothetical protein